MNAGPSNDSGDLPEKFRRGAPPNEVLVKHQLPFFKKILSDEIWYEGERRKEPVPANDLGVQRCVARIIKDHQRNCMKRAGTSLFPAYVACEICLLLEILDNERWYLSQYCNRDVGSDHPDLLPRAIDILIENQEYVHGRVLTILREAA